MTHDEHLRRIAEAPLVGALRARLRAGLDAAYRDYLAGLRALGALGRRPERERELKRLWDGRRRELHGAFVRRLREIGRGGE